MVAQAASRAEVLSRCGSWATIGSRSDWMTATHTQAKAGAAIVAASPPRRWECVWVSGGVAPSWKVAVGGVMVLPRGREWCGVRLGTFRRRAAPVTRATRSLNVLV